MWVFTQTCLGGGLKGQQGGVEIFEHSLVGSSQTVFIFQHLAPINLAGGEHGLHSSSVGMGKTHRQSTCFWGHSLGRSANSLYLLM